MTEQVDNTGTEDATAGSRESHESVPPDSDNDSDNGADTDGDDLEYSDVDSEDESVSGDDDTHYFSAEEDTEEGADPRTKVLSVPELEALFIASAPSMDGTFVTWRCLYGCRSEAYLDPFCRCRDHIGIWGQTGETCRWFSRLP